jgi:superfamily II DNA helicase RecQ
VVAQYTKRRHDFASHLYPDVLTAVARRMTDREEDEATAKATLARYITSDVESHVRERERRKAQQPPKKAPETPEQQAKREAEEGRVARETRLFEALTSLLTELDDQEPAISYSWHPHYTRAEMVQAVAPKRRQELAALLQRAAATGQALTEAVGAL